MSEEAGYETGDEVWIVVSNVRVQQCTVISVESDFVTVRFDSRDGPCAVRLSRHRLFSDEESAFRSMPRYAQQRAERYRK